MSCGAAPVTGGRRMRGGMGYGFGGAMGTGIPVWSSSWGGEVTKAGEPVTGGRRRRGSRKSRKGGKKRRSTRRGGVEEEDMPAAFPSGPAAPASMEAFPGMMSNQGPINPPRQLEAPMAEPWNPPRQLEAPAKDKTDGGRKSRKGSKKSRKGGKKSRGSRKVRKMRGGGSVGLVGASFTGSGVRGMADYSAYPSNLPPSGGFAIPTGTR